VPLGEYDEEYVMKARVKLYVSANQQEAKDKSLTVLFVIWPWDRALRQVRCDDAKTLPCIFPGIFDKTNAHIPRRQERSLSSEGTRGVHFQRSIDEMRS
jgi:hypothetical protein